MCTRTQEKGAVTPQETDQTCQCPGIPGGGVGRWWPAVGSGALSVAAHAQDFLKEVPVIFIISTIVWPQVKQQGGNTAPPINRKLDERFPEHGPLIRTRPSFPFRQSLPSRRFHKPLIPIHQRADKMKTPITEN